MPVVKREACATPPSRGVVVVHTAQNEQSCESRLRVNVGGRWAKVRGAKRNGRGALGGGGGAGLDSRLRGGRGSGRYRRQEGLTGAGEDEDEDDDGWWGIAARFRGSGRGGAGEDGADGGAEVAPVVRGDVD